METEPSKCCDNNDDNEFATPFKKYAIKGKDELHQSEFFVNIDKKLTVVIKKVSQFLENSGRKIQDVGESVYRAGDHLEHIFDHRSGESKLNSPGSSEGKTVETNPSIH